MNENLGTGAKRWVQYINGRIKQNKNFLGVFIGQTGSGKSYGALELADELMNNGLPKENICFKSSTFMARLDDGLTQGTLPKGSVLIWDEAGIGLSAKKWQSKTNRIINSIMQTFRTENIIVLFTVPYLSFIDSDARKLIHAFFQTQRIDRTNKEVICKPFNIQVNQITGKMYRKSLRIYDEMGALVKIKTIGLPMPREELVGYYEKHAQQFKRDVIREGREEMEDLEEAKNSKHKKKVELTPGGKEVLNMLAQGLKPVEIARIRRTTIQGVSTLAANAKNLAQISIENVENQTDNTKVEGSKLNLHV